MYLTVPSYLPNPLCFSQIKPDYSDTPQVNFTVYVKNSQWRKHSRFLTFGSHIADVKLMPFNRMVTAASNKLTVPTGIKNNHFSAVQAICGKKGL